MTPATRRLGGWLGAGGMSAVILSGATALALVVHPQAEPAPMMLDLSIQPASAPNIAALAEQPPEVLDQVTQQSQPTESAPPPEPETDTAPLAPVQSALSMPQIDRPAVADLTLPPPSEKTVEKVEKQEKKPEPEKKPVKRAEKKKAEKKKAKPAEIAEKAEKKGTDQTAAAKAGATSTKAGKAKGSTVSPAAYQKAVMKKLRATRKKAVKGKGTAVVAFSVNGSGALASVSILRSSGNPDIDRVALDHVRRAAPFPPPPPGAGRDFRTEFTGK